MNSWKRLPLMLLVSLGLLFFGFGCADEDEEEPPPPPPEGHLTLQTHTLDFGLTVNEQQVNISNTGDTSLTWNITTASIPYWAKANPTNGTLASDAQTPIIVRVFRAAVGPGTTTARLFFDTNANDDSLTLSVQRTCDLLADDFNDGNAANWTATALTKSQGEGYVVLSPSSAVEAARLMQMVASDPPCVISARLARITQTASYKQYGLLLEGSTTANALYFTVYVDNDTNYTLEQSVNDQWEVLHAGLTTLISTAVGEWNVLRLELYESGQKTYARAYADTVMSTPLFQDIELDPSLNFVKMGIRSEEYAIHADWFCAARQ
ncbi:MAG: hypothetical protein FJY66_00055 [Calditrichaeota bacterium]|nr:hypothetical protein [Calditrichota bacterium]